jgi:hypothetical protein
MRPCEANYREALDHLKHAYEALELPLDLTEDAVSVITLREEFRHLRREVKRFARCQHGVKVRRGRPEVE